MSDVIEIHKDSKAEVVLRYFLASTSQILGGEIFLDDDRLAPWLPGLKSSLNGLFKSSMSIPVPKGMANEINDSLETYNIEIARNMIWTVLNDAGILEEC